MKNPSRQLDRTDSGVLALRVTIDRAHNSDMCCSLPPAFMTCNDNRRKFFSSHGLFSIYVLIVSGMAIGPRPAAGAGSRLPTSQAFLDQYCASCHNQKARAAGLVLENSGPEHPDAHPELWEKVVRRLNAGEMPPAGLPRPDTPSLIKGVYGGRDP